MKKSVQLWNRRQILGSSLAAGAANALARGAFAEALVATPMMTEGPFYPDRLPLDKDNNLVIVGDHHDSADGEITQLTGRILSLTGKPINNALVEIWQVDAHGAYLHTGSANGKRRDSHFQGYGSFETDSGGRYRFRTIKPVPYPGRPAPHIHFAISRNGKRIYTTQMFVNGHPGNQRDGIFRSLREPAARQAVLVDFKPLESSQSGELAANFEIVLGFTPPDLQGDDHQS